MIEEFVSFSQFDMWLWKYIINAMGHLIYGHLFLINAVIERQWQSFGVIFFFFWVFLVQNSFVSINLRFICNFLCTVKTNINICFWTRSRIRWIFGHKGRIPRSICKTCIKFDKSFWFLKQCLWANLVFSVESWSTAIFITI